VSPDERPLSQTVPVLVAVLVCDSAAVDPGTGKKSLIGIFDRVWASKFPTNRPMFLYVKLTDAEGYYRIKVTYVQTQTGQSLAEVEGEAEFPNRLASADFYVGTPPLPIPAAGRYEFQIWANDVFLGSTFIDAIQR
jgi:hypothetical protein